MTNAAGIDVVVQSSRKEAILKNLPPFVYLSAVLQQYAGRGHLLLSGNDNSEPAAIFGGFLAGLIKSGKVLLFDVHTLKLVKDDEVEDIVAYLQHYSTDSKHPLNVGIACGLDYCVDADHLSKEVKRTGKLPSIERRSALTTLERSSKKFPVTPTVFVDTTVDPSDWSDEGPKIPLRPSFIELQLTKGRDEDAIARTRPQKPHPKIGPRKGKTETPAPAQPRDRSEYRGARKVEHLSSAYGDHQFYLSGKFNFSGYRALFLENVAAFDSQKTVGPRRHPAGSKLAKRTEELQQELDALYSTGRHKGKSHRDLCAILAAQRKTNSPLSGAGKKEKNISAETIRRETVDPGKRKPGGSLPRSVERNHEAVANRLHK